MKLIFSWLASLVRAGSQQMRSAMRQATKAEAPLTDTGPHYLTEWFTFNEYKLCVHEVKDEIVYDNGILTPAHVRSIRINVEYVNESSHSLRYSSLQWLLYDAQGYNYDSELRNQFFSEDAPRRLNEGLLNRGQRARGWVAFQIEKTAEPYYVQFRAGYLSKIAVDVRLLPPPTTS